MGHLYIPINLFKSGSTANIIYKPIKAWYLWGPDKCSPTVATKSTNTIESICNIGRCGPYNKAVDDT